MLKNKPTVVLTTIPNKHFRLVDGKKTFSPKDFEEEIKLINTLLGGLKKINHTIEVRESDKGFEVITDDYKIEEHLVVDYFNSKMSLGKSITTLVQKHSAPSNNVNIHLPDQLLLDADRNTLPEIIDNILHAKDNNEVSIIVEIQARLNKGDIHIDGECFKQNQETSNAFIVNESSNKDQRISLLLQKVDYSDAFPKLHVSIKDDQGKLSKPITLNTTPDLLSSSDLPLLAQHLIFPVGEREFFDVLADVDEKYNVQKGCSEIKKITLKEILDDGLSKYPLPI